MNNKDNENKEVCPNCGHDKYRLKKGEVFFDEIIYDRVCVRCGYKW